MNATIILFLLLWYLIGVLSFIYWWTKNNDLHTNDLPLLVLASFLGPLCFIGGLFLCGDDKVLIKKRNK